MKRARVVEIHFYEWRASTWASSETRDMLDAAGRGIYRELLDHCYLQGKFPDDPEWICRKCACTVEQYEKAWPKIVKHFPISNESGHRWNMPANIVRHEYFNFVHDQRENAKKRWLYKSNEINNNGCIPNATSVDVGMPNGNGNTTAIINNPQTPAPVGAFDLPNPKPPKKHGKRTTDEIKSSLGDRLVWWEEFWKAYPCHEGMNPAIDVYERKVHTRELAAEIWKGASRYAGRVAAERRSDPESKIKFAQGWLNDERWLDEAAPTPRLVEAPRKYFDPKSITG